jgi:subtilisin family serine protease
MSAPRRHVDQSIGRSIRSDGFAPVIVKVARRSAALDASTLSLGSAPEGAPDSLKAHFLSELPYSKQQKRALARLTKQQRPRKSKQELVAAQQEVERPRDAPRPRYFPRLGIYWGFVDREGMDSLSREERVKSIYEAAQLALIVPKETSAVAVNQQPFLWNMGDFRPLWDQGLDGEGVLVGHLDTGVDGQHEAFRDKSIRFIEVDSDGDLVEASTNNPRDSGRHGTHTAGILCGGEVDGVRIGVAPKAGLASAMVIEGGKTELRTLVALEWSLEQNVKVVNMSMGWLGYNPFFEDVIASLRDNGVVPIVAVGNEGVNTSRSPGNYEGVLSVGAVDRAGSVPEFSSSKVINRRHEPVKPDVVAPGVGIVSARAGGGLLSMDGTSMATPHVAGLVACLLGVDGATPALVERAILTSASTLAYVAQSRQGNGQIKPLAALEALRDFIANNGDGPKR